MIKFDKSRQGYDVIKKKQYDTLAPLTVSFYDNNIPINLADYTFRLECIKTDRTIVIQNTNMPIQNINELEVLLDPQITIISGTVSCQFVLLKGGLQDSTFTFFINVDASVLVGGVASNSVITILDTLIDKIDEAEVINASLDASIINGDTAKMRTDINKNTSDLVLTNEQLADITQQSIFDYKAKLRKTIYKIKSGKVVRILWLGDSITAGAGAIPGYERGYSYRELTQDKIRKAFPKANIEFVNSAVGGTGCSYLLQNWDTLVTNKGNFDLVFFAHGTNDTTATDEFIISRLNEIYGKIKSMGAENLAILHNFSRLDPSPYGNNPDADIVRRSVVYNLFKTTCENLGWAYVDTQLAVERWMMDNNSSWDKTNIKADHIHPNNMIYRVIADEVSSVLLKSLDEDSFFGGNRYGLNKINRSTLSDVNYNKYSFERFAQLDVLCQECSYGGTWETSSDTTDSKYKFASLWGNNVVTGTETAKPSGQTGWYVLSNEKEFIEFELKNVKKIWHNMYSKYGSAVDFSVKVSDDNDIITNTEIISLGNLNKTQQVKLKDNAKNIPQGITVKVRFERVSNLAPANLIIFNPIICEFYGNDTKTPVNSLGENKIIKLRGEVGYDNIKTFGKDIKNDLFGLLKLEYGGIINFDFLGSGLDLIFSSSNYGNFLVYIDDVLVKDVSNGRVLENLRVYEKITNSFKYGLHKVVIVSEKGCQTAIDTIIVSNKYNGVARCGDNITTDDEIINVSTTPFYSAFNTITPKDNINKFDLYCKKWGDVNFNNYTFDFLDINNYHSGVEFTIYGTDFDLYYKKANFHGIFDIFIDGEFHKTIDAYSLTSINNVKEEIRLTKYAEHKIRLVAKDYKNASSIYSGTKIVIEKIYQYPLIIPTFQYIESINNKSFSINGTGLFQYKVKC